MLERNLSNLSKSSQIALLGLSSAINISLIVLGYFMVTNPANYIEISIIALGLWIGFKSMGGALKSTAAIFEVLVKKSENNK